MNVSTELRRLPFVTVSGSCSGKASPDVCAALCAVVRKAYVEMTIRAATMRWNPKVLLNQEGWALVAPDAYVEVLRSPDGGRLRVNHLRETDCDLPQVVSNSNRGLAFVVHSLFGEGALVGSGRPIQLTLPDRIRDVSDVSKVGFAVDDTVKLRFFK